MLTTPLQNRLIQIIHGEPVIALGLQAMLERAGHPAKVKVFEEESGLDLCGGSPYLLVTDLETAKHIDWFKERRRDMADLKLIVVSVPHSKANCKAALETGADGVLLCAFTADEFVEAIDMVSRGSKYRCRRAELLLSESSNGDLTLREIEVVRYLAGGHAYKEIAYELGIAISTVKTHIKSIFTKLRAHNRVQASCIVSERGITPVKRLSSGAMITPQYLGHPMALDRTRMPPTRRIVS